MASDSEKFKIQLMPEFNLAPKPAPNNRGSKEKNVKYTQQAQSILSTHLQEAPTGFSGVAMKQGNHERGET
jgi:hypothetical protein